MAGQQSEAVSGHTKSRVCPTLHYINFLMMMRMGYC